MENVQATEQTNTQQETTEIQTAQATEQANTETSIMDDFYDVDKALDEQILKDNPKAETQLKEINEKKSETVTKQETQTAQPEETQETEETEETSTEGDGQTETFELPKLKWNGEEKDLKEVLKSNPDLIHELERRFDYTQKTQSLAEERKTFESEKNEFQKYAQGLQLENLAHQIGQVKNKPLLVDGLAEKSDGTFYADGEIIEENGSKFQVFTNPQSFVKAEAEYNGFLDKARTYQANIQKANEENGRNIEDFKTKYKLSNDDVKALIDKGTAYLNASVSKGQTAFPKDTWDVLYRGLYFDKLIENKVKELEAKIATAKKEGYDEALADKQGKRTVKPQGKVKTTTKADPFPELSDDIINQFNGVYAR